MANGRKTGGRQKGTPNKATADIRAIARDFGPAAIAELARMSGLTSGPGAQTEAARVACLKELLDRGYGRATQHVAGDVDAPPLEIAFSWAPALPQPEAMLAIDASNTSDLEDDTSTEMRVVWPLC